MYLTASEFSLYAIATCKQVKSTTFYLNGVKITFTYDLQWQRTLFVLYTLLPHHFISIKYSPVHLKMHGNNFFNSIFQATFCFNYRKIVINNLKYNSPLGRTKKTHSD